MTVISNDRAAYRILAPHGFFGPDDNLYEEGSEIYFDDEPNEEMEPLNELAKARLTAYLERLDSLAKAHAEKQNRPFVGRPRTLDGVIALATEAQRNSMAIMSAQKETTVVDKVEASDTPETGQANPKRGRGRPKKGASLAIAA